MNDIIATLNAERYAKPHWWATPSSNHPEIPGARPDFDDSEVACARRRRAMVEDYDRTFKKASA